MAQTQAHQKKQFTVPSRDQLVQQIKQLDEQIEHVTLNLIKCDFNATQKDVEKAFTDINFVKIKNYNPGSFEVVFEMKIDAINFIRNHYDKKILNRRFFIKMGRQQKQLVEQWTGVGFVPKTFKAPYNKGQNNQNKKQPYNKNKKVQSQTQQKHQQTTEQKPVETKQTSVVKQQQQQTKPEQKKQGKHIPKTDYQKKPYNKDNKKPYNKNDNQKTQQKTEQKNEPVKVEQTKKQVNTKKQEATKKQDKKEQKVQPKETKPEPKEQDDEWIFVSKKTTGKRK